MKGDKTLKPEDIPASSKSHDWPLLLKDYDDLNVKTGHFTIIPAGHSPLARPLEQLKLYGVICLDKPANPSSHEVVAWVKRSLKVEKTGHSGTLDPSVTGVLVVCINRATRLVKAQQEQGKEYVCVMKLHGSPPGFTEMERALNHFTGALF